jgi:hypothetical protein
MSRGIKGALIAGAATAALAPTPALASPEGGTRPYVDTGTGGVAAPEHNQQGEHRHLNHQQRMNRLARRFTRALRHDKDLPSGKNYQVYKPLKHNFAIVDDPIHVEANGQDEYFYASRPKAASTGSDNKGKSGWKVTYFASERTSHVLPDEYLDGNHQWVMETPQDTLGVPRVDPERGLVVDFATERGIATVLFGRLSIQPGIVYKHDKQPAQPEV